MLLALLLTAMPPSPPNGQWAVDETAKVSQRTLATFNARARALDETGAAQLGLCVVATTHGANSRQFATSVFNAWGVGHAGRNDGVLLFFALDDHKSEIVLGDGYPASASSDTDVIMSRDVVMNMKMGRLDEAITDAAASLSAFSRHAMADELATHGPTSDDASSEDGRLRELAEGATPIPEHSPRGWVVDLGYALSPEETADFDREGDALYARGGDKGWLFVALFHGAMKPQALASKLRRQLHREDVWVVAASMPDGRVTVDAPPSKWLAEDWQRATTRIEDDSSAQLRGERRTAVAAVLSATRATAELMRAGPPGPTVDELYQSNRTPIIGGAGMLVFVGLIGTRSWMRRRPRWCKVCQNVRHRLSEETDDPHLNPGQQVEESLGSVDYDVWWCGRCNDALVLRYGKFFTGYSTCSGCGYETMSSTSLTVVEATYSHGGTVEVTETCRNCPHVNTYQRYTSQLTRDDSSSSSSWGSSSSSDSSFGGGSSSGGGSSGSW